jgi:peptide/nickel transport system substrate-binding protein
MQLVEMESAETSRRGVALVGLVSLAGCGVFGDAQAPAAGQPAKGGTLHVLLQAPLDILDPQRNQAAIEADVLRLMTRTLTTYRSVPGQAASEIVPDLATDTGRPSDNKTVWSFTLKPGMKWENGEPIVCSQIKYGIERHYSALVNDGPTYPTPIWPTTPPRTRARGSVTTTAVRASSRSSARTSATSRSS